MLATQEISNYFGERADSLITSVSSVQGFQLQNIGNCRPEQPKQTSVIFGECADPLITHPCTNISNNAMFEKCIKIQPQFGYLEQGSKQLKQHIAK